MGVVGHMRVGLLLRRVLRMRVPILRCMLGCVLGHVLRLHWHLAGIVHRGGGGRVVRLRGVAGVHGDAVLVVLHVCLMRLMRLLIGLMCLMRLVRRVVHMTVG